MTGRVLVRGREHECQALAAVFEHIRAGGGAVALISGPAGIGKSLLLADMADRAGDAGFDVLRAAARELEQSLPFGIFADALRPRQDDPAVAEVLALLRDGDAAGRYLAHDRVLDVIERLALRGPVALVLDDLQWCDTASSAVLDRLITFTTEVPLLVALGSRRSAVADKIRPLASVDLFLGPLTADEVALLVEDRTGRRPEPHELALVDRAGGNPLFVEELLRPLERGEELTAGSVPASVHQAILSRLMFLSTDALDVLRTAAVLGSAFTVTDVAAVLGRPVAQLVPLIEEARRAGLIGEHGDALRFQHDIVHEAIYLDLPTSTRAAMHLDTGRALAAFGAPAGQVASHMVRGARVGDETAIRWIAAAASHATLTAPSVAADLLTDLVDLLPETDLRRASAMADIAFNRLWAGQLELAHEAAQAIPSTTPDAEVVVRMHELVSRLLHLEGRFGDAVSYATGAAAEARCSPRQHARLAANMAVLAYNHIDLREAASVAESAVAEARAAGSDAAESRALLASSIIAYLRGYSRVGVELTAAAVEAAQRVSARPDVTVGFVAQAARGVAAPPIESAHTFIGCDRLQEAERFARETLLAYDHHGAGEILPFAHTTMALVTMWQGAWDDAAVSANAAIRDIRAMGASWQIAWMASLLARIAAYRGEHADAAEWQARADAWAPSSATYERVFVAWSRTVVQERSGSRVEALESSAEAWRIALDHDMLGFTRYCAADRTRLLVDLGKRSEAAALLLTVDEMCRRSDGIESALAVAALCRGLVDGTPELVEEAAAGFEDAGLPLETMLAREDAARLLSLAGRADDARGALEGALVIADRLGAAGEARRIEGRLRTLGVRRGAKGRRDRPTVGWDSLTPSELRVVELAAEGLANRQVAERLYLSTRTVESHLAHVYRKLGFGTRAELAAQYVRRTESP